MIKIFIRSIFRNLQKDKFHLTLNIGGLAIGLAAFIYLASFIFYELSFDSFHTNSDRMYRCVAFAKLGNNESTFARSELPLAEAALNDLPEIEAAIRLFPIKNLVVKKDDNRFIEDEIWYAEKHLFSFFDFSLSKGNQQTALSLPHSLVLTEEAAQKYFGAENPMGQTLVIGEKKENYQVTGILKKVPGNSHLQFEMLASFSSLPEDRWGDRWGDFTATYTYVRVKEGVNISAFNEKFKHFPDKYWGPMMKNAFQKTMAELRNDGNYLRYELQPITDIHLSSTFTEELKNQGNKGMLIIIGIAGIFILIIASFNFINLSTARASLRAKEIGMKKIIGSSRKGIIFQVLAESFFHSLLALVIALAILLLSIQLINHYFGIEIGAVDLMNKYSLLTCAALPIIITLLAGVYPSVYISKYKPEEILNKKFNTGKPKAAMRNALVSVQFMVFIVLIISSFIIGKQVSFLSKQNPGFNKENVMVVKNTSRLNNNSVPYKEMLLANADVMDASFASLIPSADNESFKMFCEKGTENQTLMKLLDVDQNFYSTLNIRMQQGRWFYKDEPESEKNNAIINEEAARLMGWEDCNGKVLHSFNMGGNDYNVIGIIENFHSMSLKEKPFPMVLRITDKADFLALRIMPGKSRTINELAQAQWTKLNSDVPFEYFFLDQNFDAQYRKEEQLIKLVSVFTIIAILIACVGLFGLMSFSTLQRQKEIGIRKVNGAKIVEVMGMLNRDLVKWVIIAFVAATPVGWYAMNQWLENFAYKTTLSWWIFALAGVLALGIALLTVSWQSWRAATRNPVEALRYE